MRSPQVWAVLLSAVAVSLAQPNDWMLAGSPFLALIAWVPLFWALRHADSNRSASVLGGLFGLFTTVLQNYWLAFFQDYAIWTVVPVVLGVSVYAAILGPVLRTLLRRKDAARPFLVGAAWAVFEFLKSNGFLGFPWGLAPYPFHQWLWLIQVVDVTGLALLSFVVISWNAWLAEACERDGYLTLRAGVFFGLLVMGLVGYGFYRLEEPRPSRGTVRVALIQQNGDPWNSGDDLGPLSTSVRHSREALREAQPELMIWNETSLRHPLQEWRPYYERNPASAPLFKTIRSSKAWWLFGNPYFQDFSLEKGVHGGVVNASVLMNPQAQIVDYYGKIQQIPFAEYIPFWEVAFVKSFFQDVIGVYGSWDLGRQWTVYTVPVRGAAESFRFSTPICFEDTFAWLNATLVRNGAEVLINLTNDSWSRRQSSQWQHHVAALFRTIENRVWLVRSSNAGVTSVLDPAGRIAAGPLPAFEDDHLVYNLPLPQTHPWTFYTRWGDWLVGVFAVLLVGNLWLNRRRLS